ncbi:hypothetical protein C463_01991 [Halorubrum californiense DSM 19288]|uniref:Uncharacterized protein n=1 Tax=Halorubrum californiense DSM 19288 TaxID=1227465 RepID=M0ENS2_9EURY|nr:MULTISPECIES: hypothetical protein [Halorubrum]ELZ48019.1 hypothetical protein C463_01991 [Halorubrum californiense DSM 19288]TKX68196.1 hypothetical protein EXE40_13220 [Halorubrum sp. GN11GM_10-3_MGM]
MIGTTLLDIADHIESLAVDDGEFTLVCARYGDRPVPAAGLRFDSRETARAAARATEQYRDALRRYDPELPFYDVVARQEFAEPPARPTGRDGESPLFAPTADESLPDELADRVVGNAAHRRRGVDAGPDEERANRRTPDGATSRGRRRDRVEFCHAAAAATFEALSAGGHDRAESAVMDAYFSRAERIADPDRLCLSLLEAMATALDRHLDPATQASVLSDAADRLSEPRERPAADPVSAAFDRLAGVGLADGYERVDDPGPATEPDSSATADATVCVSGYALSPTDGRVPTLPVALELSRRDPRGRIAGVALLAGGGDPAGPDWRFRIAPDDAAVDGGPASAPVPSER